MNAYISIGNSDDKLSQAVWSAFVHEVNWDLTGFIHHGEWYSEPSAPFQNACWCIEFEEPEHELPVLRKRLSLLAAEFGQESIVLTVGEPEFIKP